MRIPIVLVLAATLACGHTYAEPARRGEAQRVVIPHSGYAVSVGPGSRVAAGTVPRAELVKAMTAWIARNFDLPATAPPAIRFETAPRIAALHHTGVLSDSPDVTASIPRGQREVVATYDPLTATIYLPAAWTGSTPAELSILVHELVHHLQHAARVRYECTQASEALAYAAQDKWLSLFGRSLAEDFEVDPFTILVAMRCIY